MLPRRGNRRVRKKTNEKTFYRFSRWTIAWTPYHPELEKIMNAAFEFTPNLDRKCRPGGGIFPKTRVGHGYYVVSSSSLYGQLIGYCSLFTVQSFENAVVMENRLNQDHAMKKFLAGVRFDNVMPNSTLPKHTMASIENNKNGRYVLLLYTCVCVCVPRLYYCLLHTIDSGRENASGSCENVSPKCSPRVFTCPGPGGLGRNERVNKPRTPSTADDQFQK